MLLLSWLAGVPLPVAAAVFDMGKRGHKHCARQRSGLINFRRYNEIGVAVCFYLIGDAFPIIGRMISMRVVHSDIYEAFLAGPWKTPL